MAYSAYAVANAFIQRAKDGRLTGLSPMKLQKLLFYTQSWHLKLADGQPLFDDFFARWKFGPVIPSLYHEFKDFGSRSIDRFATTLNLDGGAFELHAPLVPETDKNSWALIDRIIDVYGIFSGTELSNMTHREGTAWHETGQGDGGVISNDQLAEYISLKKVTEA